MSAATATTSETPITALPLVAQLRSLLAAIFGRCRGMMWFREGRGSAGEEFRTPSKVWHILPPRLLAELRYSPPVELRTRLATLDQNGRDLVDVPAAWAEIDLAPSFDRTRRDWIVAPETLDAVTSRLATFPLPVSALVDQHATLLAIWLLAEPAAVNGDPALMARVEAAQQALALAVGGRVDTVSEAQPRGTVTTVGGSRVVSHLAWSSHRPVFRLPGSRVRDFSASGWPVVLVHAELSARYSLEEIEASVFPKTKTQGKRGSK